MKASLEKWLPMAVTVLTMLGGFYYQGLAAEHRLTLLEARIAEQTALANLMREQLTDLSGSVMEFALETRRKR